MSQQKINKVAVARPLLPTWRGDREVRLLNKVPNDEVSDTTDDDSSNAAGIKIIMRNISC